MARRRVGRRDHRCVALSRRNFVAVVALCLAMLRFVPSTAGSVPVAMAPVATSAYAYDAASNASESTFAADRGTTPIWQPESRSAGISAGNLSSFSAVFVAAETGSEIPGLSSAYKDITTGNSIRNVATDVTPQQFGDNLTAEGWKVTTSTSGRGATIYTKDGATYSVYGQSTSTGGPTAQFIPRGATSPTLKIRLEN